MELKHLRIFAMCAKELNFSRVAEKVYMSQSSVSKVISALETEFSGELFVRGNRRLELTILGEGVLPFVESILSKEDEMREWLHDWQSGDSARRIVLGVPKMLVSSQANNVLVPLMDAIERFEESTDIEVRIRYLENSELESALLSKKIDLLLQVIRSEEELARVDAIVDHLCLSEHPNYLLYSSKLDDFERLTELLENLDCLFCDGEPAATKAAYDLLRKTKAPLKVVPCDNWNESILRIHNGNGATILPADSTQIAIACGLKAFSLAELGITSAMQAIWLRDTYEHIAILAQELKKSMAAMAKEI